MVDLNPGSKEIWIPEGFDIFYVISQDHYTDFDPLYISLIELNCQGCQSYKVSVLVLLVHEFEWNDHIYSIACKSRWFLMLKLSLALLLLWLWMFVGYYALIMKMRNSMD